MTQLRARRPANRPRPHTVSARARRPLVAFLDFMDALRARLGDRWPRRYADCVGKRRPCPIFTCRYNLLAEQKADGGIYFPHPDILVVLADGRIRFDHAAAARLRTTCVLEAGTARTLDDVAELLNVTGERARQIQVRASLHLYQAARARGVDLSDLPLGGNHA